MERHPCSEYSATLIHLGNRHYTAGKPALTKLEMMGVDSSLAYLTVTMRNGAVVSLQSMLRPPQSFGDAPSCLGMLDCEVHGLFIQDFDARVEAYETADEAKPTLDDYK